jgi:predicted nuclease of predicted toxin-antitoxin system
MKFKVDENLPTEARDDLCDAGHDAVTVADQHLAGQPDVQVASVCRTEGRALLTLDLDFSDIRAYPPVSYAGIIVLRPAVQSIRSIRRLVAQAIALMAVEPLSGNLWIVDDARIRIRPGSAGIL